MSLAAAHVPWTPDMERRVLPRHATAPSDPRTTHLPEASPGIGQQALPQQVKPVVGLPADPPRVQAIVGDDHFPMGRSDGMHQRPILHAAAIHRHAADPCSPAPAQDVVQLARAKTSVLRGDGWEVLVRLANRVLSRPHPRDADKPTCRWQWASNKRMLDTAILTVK